MPKSLEDSFTRHQIYLGRYANGLYRDALPELKKMRDDILARLSKGDITTYRAAKLKLELAEIKLIIDTTINKTINPKLFEDLALYEQEFALKVLDGATPASVVIGQGINASVLLPEVMASTMTLQGVKGKQTIEDVIKTFSDAHYKDIEGEIRRGIAEGLTTQEITSKVKSLSNNRTRSQAQAVVRTVTNHVATTARSKTFKEYEHLFQGEKYLATLDNRTSSVCMINSGKIFKFGEGQQVPAHYNCRSVRVAVLKPEYDLAIDSTQSSQFGQVPDSWTYDDFLKRQVAAFQNDVLGIERAKLYRKTGEPISRFVDKSGKFYTIEELKKKEL